MGVHLSANLTEDGIWRESPAGDMGALLLASMVSMLELAKSDRGYSARPV